MSDNNPNNLEESPVKGLFNSTNTDSEQQEKSTVPDTGEIHIADDEIPQPPGKIRAFFNKIVEILKQPDDTDFMFDDDDDGFEDIFAEKKAASEEKQEPLKSQEVKKPAEKPSRPPEIKKQPEKAVKAPEIRKEREERSEKPKQPEVKNPVPAVSQIKGENEEEGTVLFRSESKEDAEKHTERKETKPEEIKTEISLDDVLRVKASVTDRPGFRMTAGEIFGRNTSDEAVFTEPEAVPQPDEPMPQDIKEENVLFQRQTEMAQEQPPQPEITAKTEQTAPAEDKTEIKAESPKETRKNELSHDDAEKQQKPVEERKDELSHTVSAETPKPETPGNNELAHSEPVKPPAPAVNNVIFRSSTPAQPTRTEAPAAEQPEKNITPDRMQKDFSEEKPEPLVYKSNDSVKMVIMAGKFTSTVKNEYMKIRKLRTFAPAPKPAPEPDPEEGKKNDAEQKEKTPPKENNKKVKTLKVKKRKFRLADVFGSHDYEFIGQDTDEEVEEKPQIDDYTGPADKESIKTDLGENMRKVFVRTVILCVTCAASVINALLCQLLPELYNSVLRNGWLVFGIISFILLALSVFVTRYQIVNGLMPLRHFRGNSDTAMAVASVAGVIQSVTALFMPGIYVNGTYHLYLPLVILALMLHSFGNLLIVKRASDNFSFLCSPEAKFAGKIYTDSVNAEKFSSGLPSRHPLIAYVKESKFMSNFLRLSYEADPVESLSRFIAPFTAAISFGLAVGYGFITRDFIGGVSSFAILSVISTPMCSMIAINIPLKDLCSNALADGAMVAGYETVKQFGDTNVLMLDSSQLYPKGKIILSGIRSFNESKLKSAIMAGAAVTFAVDGPMSHIFDTIIQSRTTLPEVTMVSYDDGLGLRGWIGGQRILIGNRQLLEKHNITPPNIRIEEKYHKMGSEVSYISMGGELVAMFIMTYKTDREIAHSLRLLEDNGVSFVIRSIDCNLTPEFIADRFSLLSRCIKILPTGLGTIAYDEMTKKEKSSRAYLVTNGKLKAFASAVAGCIRMKSTVSIAKIIQYLAVALGMVLVIFISFVSGFAKLGILEMLIYTGFWIAAMIVVSAIVKKLI